ncbi:unnamed protein product [Schistosoma curassoni]|uniref:AA_permease domain-containing protein n=1 Tax=Schistosoma curassoni TaxID=6186 RepID=A0A183JKS2_9TREM|nr:unnamed protein product [Schistosoma curassoni]
MALRTHFEGVSDIGVFSKLTNNYCLVSVGSSENSNSVFRDELPENFPVIDTTIAGIRAVGRMTVGMFCGIIYLTFAVFVLILLSKVDVYRIRPSIGLQGLSFHKSPNNLTIICLSV